VGFVWWLSRRAQPFIMAGVSGWFFAVAALAPPLVIAPAYRPPAPVDIGEFTPRAVFQPADETGSVALVEAVMNTDTVQPDAYVRFTLTWAVNEPLSRDWSLFVHLTTPDGVIISQRDVYPGGGRLATSDLAAGFAWHNPVAVRVPPAAYAPATLDVKVGWYHLPTGERLRLEDGAETVTVGQVELLPRQGGELPNPIGVNFDNQIELVGYAVNTLTPAAGEALDVTLYWRALQPIPENYTVFVHAIDPRTFTIYAGSDTWPVGGSAPTSTWQPGVIIEDTHRMTVRPDTPPGIYELEIGFYTQRPDGSFARLRVVTEDGGMANDYFYLNRVRVLPAVIATEAAS
jgi:hypothetical protein